MKTRLTVSIDSDILKHAKNLANARKITVSEFIEGLLRSAPVRLGQDFATRWTGKYAVAVAHDDDQRMQALKAKYKLK